MQRRDFFAAAGAGLLGGGVPMGAVADEVPVPQAPAPGSYAWVAARARELAATGYEPASLRLSGPFADLGYDSYRGIRPRTIPLGPSRNEFAIDLLPPGFIYQEPVRVSILSDSVVQDVPFSLELFDFDPDFFPAEQLAAITSTEGMAFSGFRLRYGINRVDYLDEFAVFQGASYFRAIARKTNYGLSARALAIRTGDPRGEEFPVFRHFWIERPARGAKSITVRGLLDSPSCTGAYEFDIRPGETTTMRVDFTLFPREALEDFGLAPLTSMFLFGPQWRANVDDFRSAVHDSEGLQMVTGGNARLWRPLTNPRQVQISAFQDSGPKGFGLTQRRRDFTHYQDAEARYEKRPTGWVEPVDDWGAGAVVLVEIPTEYEFNDNIVAFWRPSDPLLPTEHGHKFAYWLHWGELPPDQGASALVYATRSGRSIHDENKRDMVVDFVSGQRWTEPLAIEGSVGGQPIAGIAPQELAGENIMRVAFTFTPPEEELLELQLQLVGSDGPVSEQWLYRWTPS